MLRCRICVETWSVLMVIPGTLHARQGGEQAGKGGAQEEERESLEEICEESFQQLQAQVEDLEADEEETSPRGPSWRTAGRWETSRRCRSEIFDIESDFSGVPKEAIRVSVIWGYM